MGEVPKQLRPYVWKKGKPGGPGRPKGKSLKEWAREYIAGMTDAERVKYLNSLDPELVWRMSEGNPPQTLQGDSENPLRVVILPESVSKSFNIDATDPKTNGGNSQQSEV